MPHTSKTNAGAHVNKSYHTHTFKKGAPLHINTPPSHVRNSKRPPNRHENTSEATRPQTSTPHREVLPSIAPSSLLGPRYTPHWPLHIPLVGYWGQFMEELFRVGWLCSSRCLYVAWMLGCSISCLRRRRDCELIDGWDGCKAWHYNKQ